ncbi:hypothetical protein HAX54_002003 [Datura stramonium]|uniref:Uncharacterized protein n=1 Tax=Datura stramonium TaxID=4076 RepID=A0ABS8T373_DATST|nr:hypothetical protein [Datura stramonium]
MRDKGDTYKAMENQREEEEENSFPTMVTTETSMVKDEDISKKGNESPTIQQDENYNNIKKPKEKQDNEMKDCPKVDKEPQSINLGELTQDPPENLQLQLLNSQPEQLEETEEQIL